MKQQVANKSEAQPNLSRRFGNACTASCRKLAATIAAAKEAIFAESTQSFKSQERLLRMALNEAEAVAWQTIYPHLVFPALATEKVQAVIAWEAHQRSVRQASPAFDWSD